MAMINILDEDTINQIAAGEVVERPKAVVKELVENAIDAKATAITVEIKEGGISFIRITDNGSGIEKEDIPLAFLAHATSKIQSISDLNAIASLGFRGEALSSISAVSMMELITKTREDITGTRYVIEGGQEKSREEIGCPDGTTFIIRNLFYNTPARRKFLKTAQTEGSYISDLMERMALSNPSIAFKFIVNGQLKLQTSGNGKEKDIIYHIYGKDITKNLIPIEEKENGICVSGFLGKPIISRGNRNYMNYYINGRFVKSGIIDKAILDSYKPYSMQHRFPFTTLDISIPPSTLDVNVHPTKMEVRFDDDTFIYNELSRIISNALKPKEYIQEVSFGEARPKNEPKKTVPVLKQHGAEPFETKRIEKELQKPVEKNIYELEKKPVEEKTFRETVKAEQLSLNLKQTETKVKEETEEKEIPAFRIIGQIFNTYWIIEFEEKMLMIDQHAAHEKILYEKLMKDIKANNPSTQMLNPPIILSLSMSEIQTVNTHMEILENIGFSLEHFGGNEYAVNGIPYHLPTLAQKDLLIEMIDILDSANTAKTPDILLDKVASMSCKAAVKGNMHLSYEEAKKLITDLMTLENPYHCPHGRPTIISMSKYEIEKKFKRIL